MFVKIFQVSSDEVMGELSKFVEFQIKNILKFVHVISARRAKHLDSTHVYILSCKHISRPIRACTYYLRAHLQGGGGPQVGEVTCGGSPYLSYKSDQIKKREYMDRRVTPPKRVTSPTWGPPPPCIHKRCYQLYRSL